jgi:hypothetical protein
MSKAHPAPRPAPWRGTLLLLAATALAACGGSTVSVRAPGEFEAFVLDRFAETSDLTAPTPTNGRAFADRTTLDERAFDTLLPD